MSLLNDLLEFVKTRMPDGTSFKEIQEYLEIEDKVEVRNLIDDALNRNMITKTGERRGTRYLARDGATVQDDSEIVPDIQNKALDTYLNDPTPVHDAIIVHSENIVPFKNPKTLNEFIKNGRKITTFVVSYDYEKKKNVIFDTSSMMRMNYFVIRFSEQVIEKFDQITGKKELIDFDNFDGLRELLTIETTQSVNQ
jgi:hypothetical protein